MNAEIYAEWFRRQGQRVLRTASSWWHSERMGAFQAFPYHWLIQPAEGELHELMSGHRVTALRFSAPPSLPSPADGYHAVYTGPDYDFNVLSSWARKNVRRGLRNCTVARISFDRFLEEGWALRADTLARQGRERQTKQGWQGRYKAAADLPGFEVWAAEVQARVAATVVTFQMDHWLYMVSQQCHSDYFREHVNNALGFVVTQDFIRRPGAQGVFYGMKSLDAPPSVDEFKFRMGYEAKAVRQPVIFNPYLSPLVNSYTHRVAKALIALSPRSRLLAKAEGMMRACLAEKQLPVREGLSCDPRKTEIERS